MLILLWEKWKGKPIQWRWIATFFLWCLFVSCYQAWIDEHHNSEALITDKNKLASDNWSLQNKLDTKQGEVDWLRDHRSDVIVQPARVVVRGQTEGIRPPAIQEMSSKQLRTRVIEFAREMRKYAGDFTHSENEFFQTREQITRRNPALSEAQKKTALTEGTNALYQGHLAALEIEFRQSYAGSATEYRDELIRRLGPQKPLTPAQQFDLAWPTNTYRGLFTPATVMNSADYLDSLARQLPAR